MQNREINLKLNKPEWEYLEHLKGQINDLIDMKDLGINTFDNVDTLRFLINGLRRFKEPGVGERCSDQENVIVAIYETKNRRSKS